MDINSLLSPSETPTSETPPPAPAHSPATSSPAPTSSPSRQQRPGKLAKRNSSALSQQVLLSSHNQSPLPSPKDQLLTPLSYRGDGALQGFPQMSLNSPGYTSIPGNGRIGSATNSPTPGERGSQPPMMRQASTPGMDTLADLAALQARNSPGGTKQGGLNIANPPRQLSASSAKDIIMAERSPKLPRTFSSSSISAEDAQALSLLSQQLTEKPLDYSAHLQYIGLLRTGLVAHMEQSQPAHTYELLTDLNNARQNMDNVYTLGEELWADWVLDSRNAVFEKSRMGTSEERVNERLKVTELFGKCLAEEPHSTRLWRLYGDYSYELWASANQAPGGQSWEEEDRLIGKEVFTWESMTTVWDQGVSATQWQISGSEIVWDRYMEILLQEQQARKDPKMKTIIEQTFAARLMRPHTTWDHTFELYSNFISHHYNSQYETIMENANREAGQAKKLVQLRENYELKIQIATQNRDKEAERAAYQAYMDWELRHKGVFSFDHINGLYQRLTTRFSIDAETWIDYLEFLIQNKDHAVSTLEVAERATRHCPWSGDLWSHRLLTLEAEQKAFQELEIVKHRATKTGMLDHGGMEELLKVYVTWCGFLRRKAFEIPGASEDDIDIAEMGIRSALEHVKEIGVKKYGAGWTGDPLYRLERIHIKFFLQSGNIEAARKSWEDLVKHQKDSYDFWYRYYIFEMVLWSKFSTRDTPKQQTRPPWECTALLRRSLQHVQTMDWPEQLIQMFLNHCEQHESVRELRVAIIEARRAHAEVAKRRGRETEAAAAQQPQPIGYPEVAMEDVQNNGKRKRESDAVEGGQITKRAKAIDEAEPTHQSIETAPMSTTSQQPKRDRENTTVMVRNLPETATEVKIRRFFNDCGKIISLNIVEENAGLLATVEFETADEAQYAQTKQVRPFDGNEVSISVGTETTLWVTNYPPEADEEALRQIFEPFGSIVSMRFPSLKYDSHRRFCYVQFADRQEALAATAVDGLEIDAEHKLVAKVSNPGAKGARSGAIYEGREIMIRNISFDATGKDVQELVEQHGKIESVRMPKKVGNKHKGMAFVIYETVDEAQAAVSALHDKPFMARNLSVVISDPNHKGGKSTIQTTILGSATPEADAANGKRAASSQPDYKSRTLALLNIPDTVNDSRIRQLAEKYGPLNKIILRHEHQGALIEFATLQDMGKASLGLDGFEITPGRRLRVGTASELKAQKAEYRSDKLGDKKKMEQAKKEDGKKDEKKGGDATLRLLAGRSSRPLQTGRKGGRGGLGFRSNPAAGATGQSGEANGDAAAASEGKKSNADFKAMFLGGGEKKDGEGA